VQSLRAITAAREGQPDSARLRRFEVVLGTFRMLQERRVAEAVLATQEALRELMEPDFEFEAACNLLCLLARMLAREMRLEDLTDQMQALADRFAVSRTTCELMCRAVQGCPDLEAVIRARYERVCAHAERAVSHTIAGAPREAVLELLAHFERSLNAKLLDLAMHTLERHAKEMTGAAELLERAEALHARYRSYGTQVQIQWRPPGVALPRANRETVRPS